jgi:hypothetical protein
MCDFWRIHGVHQFLNLVVAHIYPMQRICGQYNTDRQIANPAQQRAPPPTESIKVGRIKSRGGDPASARKSEGNQADGGALEPSKARYGAGWHRTRSVQERRASEAGNTKRLTNGPTTAQEVCDPAKFRARASTSATHRKMTSARDVNIVLSTGEYCTRGRCRRLVGSFGTGVA